MNLPPLVEREFRRALLHDLAWRNRLKLSTIGVLVVAVLALFVGRHPGLILHSLCCWTGLWLLTSTAPAAVADLFAEDRRNQTLGFFFLAGLRAREVFLFKLLGAVVVAVNGVCLIIPFLALSFVMGGVNFTLFSATIVAMFSLLAFMISVGALGSVVSRDASGAMTVSAIIGGVICFLPVGLYLGGRILTGPGASNTSLLFSPAYGAFMVYRQFSAGTPAEFWLTMVATWIWSAVAFALAAYFLNETWQEDPDAVLLARWRRWWQRFLGETDAERRERRRHSLETNPASWLVLYNADPVRMAWAVVGAVGAAWLAGLCLWRENWLNPVTFIFTAALVNLVVGRIANYALVKPLGEDRRSGGLELLLTTRLEPLDLLSGHINAVRTQFKPLAMKLLLVFSLFALAGLARCSRWSPGVWFDYVAFWVVLLSWTASLGWHDQHNARLLWVAVNTGRPGYAVLAANGLTTTGVFWLFYQFHRALNIVSISSFPSGSWLETIFAIGGLFYVGYRLFMRDYNAQLFDQLVMDLRDIAREPLREANDPVFKSWNGNERLPQAGK